MRTYLRSGLNQVAVPIAFVALLMAMLFSAPAFAVDELDSLGGGDGTSQGTSTETEENLRRAQELMGNSETQDSQGTQTPPAGTVNDQPLIDVDKNEDNIGNQLKNQQYVSTNDIANAQKIASPITNFIGTIIGFIIVIAVAAHILITALDIVYLAFPPLRQYLASGSANGAGGQMAGMGFGRTAPAQTGGSQRQWVSDSAVSVASLYGGAAPAQGQGMMNPGGYGSPQMSPAQSQEGGKKNVFWEYLKKRAVSTIFFVFALIFLTSSQLMDVGLNAAQWGIGLLDWINGKI